MSLINLQTEELKEITGTTENVCNCKTCVNMCTTPCLGTPADILKIVKAGYHKNLAFTVWAAGVLKGVNPIKMIQPIMDSRKGSCTFLDENNDCALHAIGIKPTEGRLASCKTTDMQTPLHLSLNTAVALTWIEPEAAPVLMEIVNELKAQLAKDAEASK